MGQHSALSRRIGAGKGLFASVSAQGLRRRTRGIAGAALLLLGGLVATPAFAQNTSVTITGSRPATFARVGQVITFNVRFYTGNAPMAGLSFDSGEPVGASPLSCPGLPADLATNVDCTFTYTVQPTDMAMNQIRALGRWRAKRVSGADRTGTTNTLMVYYAPPRTPDAPAVGTVTAGNGQATVSFNAPDFDGGWPVDSYTVTSMPGGMTATGTGSPITVSGLTNGVAYRFTVAATNVLGAGAASAQSNAVTPIAPQTITFANPGGQTFGTTPTLSATATSGLPVTFASGTPAVCAVSPGGALGFGSAGICTITASQAGNAAFAAAAPVSQSFAVNAVVPGAPTIGVATAANGQATITFSAPASTGGAALTGYTVTSSPGGITATGMASPITITGLANGTTYTFTVTASNSAGTGAASAATNAVTPKVSQVITFAQPAAQAFGTTPTLTATSSAGLPVAFSSSAPAVCSVTADGTLAFAATGTCTVAADQSGDAATNAAATVTRSFAVNAVAPHAPTMGVATAGNGQANVSFTAPAFTGGAPVTAYTVTSLPGGITATGAGSPVTVAGLANGVGYRFTVTATTSAGTSGASAQSNAVTPQGTQAITFADPGTQRFGTTPTLSATASSGLPVAFSSATPAVCTVTSGGQLAFASAGTCTVHADQPGDAAHLPAPQVSRTLTVDAVLPGAPTAVSAVAGDGQASVSFVAPVATGGADITGYRVAASSGNVVVTGTGSPIVVSGLTNGTAYLFSVTALNAAGQGAAAASNVVTPMGSQVITFANPGAQAFGSSPTLTATSSAGNGYPVTFGSSTSGVCTVSAGGVLTTIAAGTCTIHADQSGDAGMQPAATVTQSFAINAIAADAPVIGSAVAGNGTATVSFTAPASSGGVPIMGYTVTSLPGGITASGAGSPITVTGLTNGRAYTFTVVATNAAGASSSSTASNTVTPQASQVITFADPGAQLFGTTPTLVATSDAGLPVSFTSSTPGVCTVSAGGTLAFAAVGTCTVHADQPGTAAVLPAARVSRSFAVNPDVPGAPTAVTAAGGNGQATVSFVAPATNGGTAITGYTVTSSPGGIAATGTASPILVTGLTNGVTYTFTVTATNSAGTGSASAASNAVTPVPPLTVGPATLNVPYGAGTTPVTLDIRGTATSVAIGTAPSRGTAVASGTTIRYTPATGYAGPDSFTYVATDGLTTTAPATVTVTVADASVSIDTAPLADAVGGSAYSHAFTATGGIGPYAFTLVADTLPNGMTLSPAGVLSGTPTQAGSFAFTVQATDVSTGTGPFSTQRAVTLVVQAPQIAFTVDVLQPVTFGTAASQTLQATGGTAPYSYVITAGTLPQGMTLSSAGLLSGTATETGRFTITVEVRDANGFTASSAYELVVEPATQAITAFASNPAAPVFAPAGTFAVGAQGGASGNPVLFASTTPAVCTVAGTTVTMRAAGRCSLTADQAGDARYGAAPQARLDIDIAAAVPVLAWPSQISKMLGEPAFDLDNPQSPSAGAFTFTSSRTDVATISGRTVTLRAAGTTVITATQAAHGNYAAATVQMELVVTGRPDPTRDPGVTGLLKAQADASVRFANAQQSNIRDRLRQVRSGGNASSANLTLASGGSEGAAGTSVPVSAANAWPAMPRGWGAWLSGTATFGSSGRANGLDFRTDGITVGMDRALGEALLVGVAASFGRNESELDDDASRMDADQRSLAIYGLWRMGGNLFVDGVVGTGRLGFDMQRWSTDADAMSAGNRDGDQRFASVALGYEHRGSALTLTGYGRVDASRTELDGYRETGLGVYDLAYRRQVLENSAVALGLEGSWLVGGASGRVRPFWSVEYRQAIDDKGEAAMNYVVLPAASDYRLRMSTYNDNALSLSAGFDLVMQRGWLLSLVFGHEQSRNSTAAGSVGLRLSYGNAAPADAAAKELLQPDSTTPPKDGCGGPRCARPAAR